jgi:uncharacterized protein
MNDATPPPNSHPPGNESFPSDRSLDVAPPPGRLSIPLTLVMALLLVSGIGFFIWLQLSVPRMERVGFPERALPHMVGRTMDLEEAIGRAPAWEQALYRLTTDNGSNDLRQAIDWYRELAELTYNPEIHVQWAILEAEAGRLTDLSPRLSEWDDREEPFPMFARWLRAAYVDPRMDLGTARALQAEIADALPAGWFYDKIATKLAERSNDSERVAALHAETDARVKPLLVKVRLMTGGELVLMLLGLPALVILLRRRGRPYPVGAALLPPPWRGRVGVAVLIRGGALGMLLSVAFLFVEADSPLIRLSSMPLASLPLLALARQHLLAPHGLGFMRGFGLRIVPQGEGRLMTATLAVLAAGLIGEWGLGVVAEWWGLSTHWTEWFDGDLVWGETGMVVVSLLEFVVLAPLFEELAFRGLLFGTLRRRFNWSTSAAVSAGIFAIAHGYGVLGFVSVFWSGLLWAWIYEKTGSLLPSMCAHAANNALVCLSILYFFRS